MTKISSKTFFFECLALLQLLLLPFFGLAISGCSEDYRTSNQILDHELLESEGRKSRVQVSITSRLRQEELAALVASKREELVSKISGLSQEDFVDQTESKRISQQLAQILGSEGKIIRVTLEIIPVESFQPDPEVLEELQKLPGTLGYVDR